MPHVRGWIERGEDGNLRVVSEISLPAQLHKPETKVVLEANWPRTQGALDEAHLSGSLPIAAVGGSAGMSSSIQFGLPVIGQVTLGANHSTLTQRAAAQQYGSYSGQVVELSGFSPEVQITRAFYRVVFPVLNPQGHGRGANLRWKLTPETEWRNVPLEYTELWGEEVKRRLPSSYWLYHGNADLRERLAQELVRDWGPQTIVLHGPGGIGKTALVRASLASVQDPPWSRVLGFTAQGEYFDPLEGRRRPREPQAKAKHDMYKLLADDLRLAWDGEQLEEAHRMARGRISAERRVLFILDNLETTEELEGFIPLVLGLLEPRPKGLVIVTTRELPDDWDQKQHILSASGILTERLGRLTSMDIEAIVRDVAIYVYGPTVPPINQDDLNRIVERCDGHPLSAKFFTHAYYAGQREFLRTSEARQALLEFCFRVQWERLNESQQTILRRLVGMGPTPIPEDELIKSLSLMYGKRGAVQALRRIESLSFVELSGGTETNYVSLHSLVREWLETN